MHAKKRILMFNLAVDERDPILGFAVPLIARIAQDAAAVHVITVRTGTYSLPANVSVRSIGRERGVGKIIAVAAFYRHLFAVLRTERITACFSHMNPFFVVLASPVLAARRVPVVLWYSHRAQGLIIRIACRFAARIVTSADMGHSFPLKKTIVTGHMVDTGLFTPDSSVQKDDPPLFVSVGRISPIKDLMTFIRAAGILRDTGYRFTCLCVGPVLARDQDYYATLIAEIGRLSLDGIFSFTGAMPRVTLPGIYRRATAHVNACPRGALDKTVLEAMACGTPSVFANDAFAAVIPAFAGSLHFRYGDPVDLARVLRSIRAILPSAAVFREAVVRGHNMESFVGRLLPLLP